MSTPFDEEEALRCDIGVPISVRLLHCLANEDCKTLADVATKHLDLTWIPWQWCRTRCPDCIPGRYFKRWLRVPNLGPRSFKELSDLLEWSKK